MKKIILIMLLVTLVANAQWVPLNGIPINSAILTLNTNGTNIYAGASSTGLYISTNSGLNWNQTSLGNKWVYSVVSSGNNVYAGTDSGFYSSTNNGTNWIRGNLSHPVYQVAINGNTIFAGVDSGVYKTTNNGLNWIQTSLIHWVVLSFAVTNNYIFVGTTDNISLGAVYRSSDNGNTWSLISNMLINSFDVSGNNIIAGTYYGVYVSSNNGTSWTLLGLATQHVSAVLTSGSNIFAGALNAFFVSNDFGNNWVPRSDNVGNVHYRAVCLFNGFVYIGTNYYGAYRRPISELTSIHPISNEIQNEFSLTQNYPNPFNPKTKIKFALPSGVNGQSSIVNIKIFDILGKEVATLVNEQLQPGTYETDWDASKEPSGVYYYKLTAGDYTETKKMVLVK